MFYFFISTCKDNNTYFDITSVYKYITLSVLYDTDNNLYIVYFLCALSPQFFILLDKIIFHNKNIYILFLTLYERCLNGVDNEMSGVDRSISWKLNGKAMKYKYGTQESVLSYLNHFLILFTCFHISTYIFQYAS